MSAVAIYGKTSSGLQEMSSRKLKLLPRLRTMLILVDGHQPVFVLKEEAEKLGAPADFLEQLLRMQLIEKIGIASGQPAETGNDAQELPVVVGGDEFTRFRAAKDLMNVTAVHALGIRSFFFTLKLERAGNLADLRELVSAYREAIAKGSGAEEAQVFTERLKAMLR